MGGGLGGGSVGCVLWETGLELSLPAPEETRASKQAWPSDEGSRAPGSVKLARAFGWWGGEASALSPGRGSRSKHV